MNDPNAADAILDRLKALGDLADSAAQPATALYCRSLALWLEGGRHIADDDLSRRLQALAARIDELPWKGQRSDTGWQLVRAGVQAVLARLHDILPALFQTADGMQKLDRWIATPVTRIRELHGLIDAIGRFCSEEGRVRVSRAYLALWQLSVSVYSEHPDHSRIETAVDELQRICDSRSGVAESDEDAHTLRHLAVRAMAVQAYALVIEGGIAQVESLAERVEQIAGAPAHAADRDMQLERAGAWRSLAFAHAKHGEGDATRAAVERVEQIAEAPAYAADRDMQHERAQAWCCLALAHFGAGQYPAMQSAADMVEAICCADSLTVSGNTWNPARDELITLYNYLLRNLTGNAALRRQLVERFRTIAQRFPDDAEIRRFWAQLQVVASPDTASVRPVSFGVSAWAQGAATSAYSVSFTGYRPPGSDKNSSDREDAIDSRPDGDREG